MLNCLIHVRYPASLVGAKRVIHSVLLEQSESVLVDSMDDGIVHVPLLGLQHSMVHSAVRQLGKLDLMKLQLNLRGDYQVCIF